MASSHDLGRAATGLHAEAMAASFLEARGFEIVARNWRRPEGELDLVANHRGVCVFVEVRSRTGTEHGHALETITASKRSRLIRAARLYLQAESPAASAYRFDVVGITFPTEGGEPELVHVEDAFRLA